MGTNNNNNIIENNISSPINNGNPLILESYLNTTTDNNNNNNSNTLSLANDVETARNKVITLTTEKHALELEILKYKKKNNILSNENISLKQQYEQLSNNYNDIQTSLLKSKENEQTVSKRMRIKLGCWYHNVMIYKLN